MSEGLDSILSLPVITMISAVNQKSAHGWTSGCFIYQDNLVLLTGHLFLGVVQRGRGKKTSHCQEVILRGKTCTGFLNIQTNEGTMYEM